MFKRVVAIVGGGSVSLRALNAASKYPLRDAIDVIVGSTQFLPSVTRLAVCYRFPFEMPAFLGRLSQSSCVYFGLPPACNLGYVQSWFGRSAKTPMIALEKPICTVAQVPAMREASQHVDLLAVDHWTVNPVLRELPPSLMYARRQFGKLLWIDVRMLERRCVSHENVAPLLSVGGIWHEYCPHFVSVLWSIFPSLRFEMTACRLFEMSHDTAPAGVATFATLAGLVNGLPTAIAPSGTVAITFQGGKATHRDEKVFRFVFEHGEATYDHTGVEIAIQPFACERRVLFSKPSDPYELVWSGLVSGDRTPFMPIGQALRVVETLDEVKTKCGLSAEERRRVPCMYAPGSAPFPAWPVDGFLAVTVLPLVRAWIGVSGFFESPVVRANLLTSSLTNMSDLSGFLRQFAKES